MSSVETHPQIEPSAPIWKSSFFVGTAVVWGFFLCYMIFAVPFIEGQSAGQIPKLVPDGFLKTNLAGRWLSLFPKDSWQRDEKNRNVIQAKRTILIFKDYKIRKDGFIKVDQLSLLLFDKPENPDEDRTDLNRQSLQGYPLIVDANEGALLKTKKSKAGDIGEVQEIRFLGVAEFSKRNEDLQKSFQINTKNLVINSQTATTTEEVHIRFGDSIGTATGLNVSFSSSQNPDPSNRKLTDIDEIHTLKFGSVEHFQIRIPQKTSPGEFDQYGIRSQGPAEFDFGKNRLNFSNSVVVDHYAEESQLFCEALDVWFDEKEAPTAESDKKSFFNKGMKPRQFIARGMPARVISKKDSGSVLAEIVDYQFHKNQVVLSSPKNIWVKVQTKEATLHVPRMVFTKESKNPGAKLLTVSFADRKSGSKSPIPGTLEAFGNGTLVLNQISNEEKQLNGNPVDKKVVVTWTDKLSAKPDQENSKQTVISIFGNCLAQIGKEKSVKSRAMHLWTKPSEKAPGQKQQGISEKFSGASFDFLLASGDVRVATENLTAEVSEARLFFDDGGSNRVSKNPLPRHHRQIRGFHHPDQLLDQQRNTLQTITHPSPRIPSGIRHSVMKVIAEVAKPKSERTKVTGKYVTAKLRTIKNPDGSSGLQVDFIDIQEDVKIYPEAKANEQPNKKSAKFFIHANRVVGQASANPNPINTGKMPKLRWTVFGWKDRMAEIHSKGFQFLGNPIFFDQTSNHVWTEKEQPGLMRFPIHEGGSGIFKQNQSQQKFAFPVVKKDQAIGFGEVKWRNQLVFDGKKAELTGLVDCFLETKNKKGNRETTKANGDKLELVLEFPVSFDDNQKNSETPAVESLTISTLPIDPKEQTVPIGTAQPERFARIYQLEVNPNGQPVSEYLVKCQKIHYNELEKRIQVKGPRGKLWFTGTRGSSKNSFAGGTSRPKNDKKGSLEYLKVDFKKDVDVFIDQGKFVINGPSTSLQGYLPSWQQKDESNLIDPKKITSNWLTINQWKPNGAVQPVTEFNAKGSVHVQGPDYELLASELRYNQKQDLFVAQGDARAAAQVIQIDPKSNKKNRMSASTIWYRPSDGWYNLDGFSGDLNHFNKRK